jgi:retinol dehydrogenase-12
MSRRPAVAAPGRAHAPWVELGPDEPSRLAAGADAQAGKARLSAAHGHFGGCAAQQAMLARMTPPDGSTPSLRGRVALVTGANTGIGLVTARELARRGARVFLACRSAERGRHAADTIRAAVAEAEVDTLPLDLGDLDSVRDCARTFLALDLPLHLLVNNAGLAGTRGSTRSGFELAFGVAHVGHFLLTQCLVERVVRSSPARIVTVSSNAHFRATGIDWEAVRRPTRTRTGLPEYAVAKLANVLFATELGRRLFGTDVITSSLHPGVVASDVWRSVPWPIRPLIKLAMVSPDEGARTTLHCATSDEVAAQTGLYYDACRARPPSVLARDAALAAELWRRSEDWVR